MTIDLQRINRTVVRISEDEAVQNFKESYQDVIMDSDQEEIAEMAKNFYDDCKNIKDRNYRKLFRDGMTMMLLGPEAFKAVDDYFLTKRKFDRQAAEESSYTYKMELVVVIDCGDEMITIEEQDVSY